MKKATFAIALALFMGLAAIGYFNHDANAHAQSVGASPIQQVAQELRAATNVSHNHTSNTTTTITPPGNQYVYITGIDISNCAGGTAVTAAAPTYITTTGITGAPQYQLGSGVTAGLCTSTPTGPLASFPLKSSTPGANVTFVVPTFATNQTVSLNVYYYFAQ